MKFKRAKTRLFNIVHVRAVLKLAMFLVVISRNYFRFFCVTGAWIKRGIRAEGEIGDWN